VQEVAVTPGELLAAADLIHYALGACEKDEEEASSGGQRTEVGCQSAEGRLTGSNAHPECPPSSVGAALRGDSGPHRPPGRDPQVSYRFLSVSIRGCITLLRLSVCGSWQCHEGTFDAKP
jgi:hypothetical protein